MKLLEEMVPFYAQVIGIGILWVTVHCIGMCGPIMVSLTTGMGVHRAPTRGARFRRALTAVLAYQTGRAVIYAGLGATAGLVGATARVLIEDVARTAGLVVAGAIIIFAIWKLLPLRSWSSAPGWGEKAAIWTGRLLRAARRIVPASGVTGMLVFGAVLGFLPCMLMFWILGIAASTASVFHGAMVMVLLVVMTTPVLVFAACGSSLPGVFSHLRSDRVIGIAMLFSGVWLALIAVAANGWIEHLHFPFTAWGHELVIMLW